MKLVDMVDVDWVRVEGEGGWMDIVFVQAI
jgi:hypothetical protein